MKKIFKLFSVLVILPIGFLLSAVVFQNSNSAAALGGEGTLQNPYTIGSAEDLLQFAQYINNNALPYSQADKHFVLTADINLSNYGVSYNGGKGWVPIGTIDKPFKGNFDGNGHKISGLYIHNYNLDCAGLFGGVGIGVVKDCALLNVNINAKSNVGGVVGLLEAYGKIEGCYVTGTVNGINYFIGGIAGSVNDSTGINCYTTCDINGKDDAGGIAGSIYNSTISNCYATGNIDVTDDGVGGIAAYVTGSAKIENCVALNLTVSGDYDGRILGRGNGTLINNYALSILKDKNGETSSWTNKGTNQKDGADVNTADCLTALFWTGSSVGWDTNVWNVQNGRLPELLKIGGTGTVPEHLKTDILSATVVVTPGTYAYTGSIILPQNMSVTLDGKALTQSQDYTYSITSTDGGGASAGKNTGIVTITISGDGAYKGTVTKTYTIVKANPTYTAPSDLTAVYGDNLSSVILPAGFTFESAGLVGNEGANIFYVTFTPSDIVNYNIVNNIAVTVTVGRKAIAVPNAINGLVYTGAEQTGVNAGAGYTVTFGVAVNAGTYYAMVTLDGNHKWDSVNDVTSERIVKFNIAKVNPAYTVPTGLEAVYGDNLSSVILPAGFIFESAGLVGSEGANIFYVTFTPSDIVNYNIVNNIAVTVTVGRKAIAVPNAINGLVYTGAEQTGVNAGAGYTVTFGAAVNAGTYYATVTLDGNHKWNSVNDVTSERVIEFNIAKANPAYTVPTGLEAVYGDNLSSVILPEGFTFESEGLVGNEGANIFYATFTPSDIVNYNIITGIEITVMVKSDVKEPVEPPTTTGPTTPTEPTKPLEPTSPSGGPDNDANSIVWIIIGIIAGSFTVLLGYAILKRKLKSSKTKSQKAET
ncbi:MAG: hypothetical protein FWG51_00245 [Firmicutes bacterium]|nr:hypothetical protein [Bacillota bacterium]